MRIAFGSVQGLKESSDLLVRAFKHVCESDFKKLLDRHGTKPIYVLVGVDFRNMAIKMVKQYPEYKIRWVLTEEDVGTYKEELFSIGGNMAFIVDEGKDDDTMEFEFDENLDKEDTITDEEEEEEIDDWFTEDDTWGDEQDENEEDDIGNDEFKVVDSNMNNKSEEGVNNFLSDGSIFGNDFGCSLRWNGFGGGFDFDSVKRLPMPDKVFDTNLMLYPEMHKPDIFGNTSGFLGSLDFDTNWVQTRGKYLSTYRCITAYSDIYDRLYIDWLETGETTRDALRDYFYHNLDYIPENFEFAVVYYYDKYLIGELNHEADIHSRL